MIFVCGGRAGSADSEKVPPDESVKDLIRLRQSGKFLRSSYRYLREECRLNEKFLDRLVGPLEDLLGKVLKYALPGQAFRPVARAPCPFRHEHKTRSPSLGDQMDPERNFVGNRLPTTKLQYSPRFFLVETDLVPPDDLHAAVCAQSGELRGRVAPTDDYGCYPLRDGRKAVLQYHGQAGILSCILIIIEHDNSGRSQTAEEVLEVSLGKNRYAELIFRRQEGQGPFYSRRCLPTGEPEIIKERGYIGIACIHLIPEAGKFAGIKITRDEGRFAGAGRSGDPDDGSLLPG